MKMTSIANCTVISTRKEVTYYHSDVIALKRILYTSYPRARLLNVLLRYSLCV